MNEIMYKIVIAIASFFLLTCTTPKTVVKDRSDLTAEDRAMLDDVQRRTFQYFWEAAEPNSGLARERYHMNGVYPQNDKNVVTSGGSGFGIMAIISGIYRGYVTKEQGIERMERILNFLESADRFHGAFPHWWNGESGKVKPFSKKDDGGDLVETSFLMQGLLAARQFFSKWQ